MFCPGSVWRLIIKPEAPVCPGKLPGRGFRDSASMLMKGGNSGEHKDDREEEEGCIRGETPGGGQ